MARVVPVTSQAGVLWHTVAGATPPSSPRARAVTSLRSARLRRMRITDGETLCSEGSGRAESG